MTQGQKAGPLHKLLMGGHRASATDEEVVRERARLWTHWGEHPWNFLTGVDTTDRSPEYPLGRPIIFTTDERSDTEPVKAFPGHLEYLRRYVNVLVDPVLGKMVLVDKSRQMFVSYCTLLVMHWYAIFRPHRRMLISKHKEEEAADLMNDKIRATHWRLPEWVQQLAPITKTPYTRIDYLKSGSKIKAVAQNVANSEARGGTVSVIFIDEAALQDTLCDMIAASLPMAQRLWGVTTAQMGTPGARCFKTYLDEGRDE